MSSGQHTQSEESTGRTALSTGPRRLYESLRRAANAVGSLWSGAGFRRGRNASADAHEFGSEGNERVVVDGGETAKVVGELEEGDGGVGVLGRNTAASGTTYGVKGAVDSEDGYGLYTPDDARIDGVVTSDGEWRVEVESDGSDTGNVVAGHPSNWVDSLVVGATIAGGGFESDGTDESHEITANYGTISGGKDNRISGYAGTVGGGNLCSGHGSFSAVSGGLGNHANGTYGAVAGGLANTVNGSEAAIPGGRNNVANGDFSIAAGRNAKASHDGTFVVGDSSSTQVESQGSDEARFQMEVYAPAFETISARSQKTDLEAIDPTDVLEGVESLDVTTWTFRDREGGRHMGPMAEDFFETFELGGDDATIATVDADGVALAAIQGLSRRLDETKRKLDAKDDRIDELEGRLAALEERVDTAMAPGAAD